MIFGSLFIIGLYVFLMLLLKRGQNKLAPFILGSSKSITQFSVIVPFRDEAHNLEALLNSFQNLDYPKDLFEIILVNDFSSDNFLEIITKYKDLLPNLSRIDAIESNMSPKKAALSLGISKAKYDWIITTDADCIVPKTWLKAFHQKITNDKPLLVVGLVSFNPVSSFLDKFQALDLLSLQATLLGTFGLKKPMLCHGANLCYAKSLFYELNGFESHQNIASGDDVFLLEEAVKKHPDKVVVINSLDAVVATKPEPTFKALLSQRMRWAAKATSYNNLHIKIVGFIVFAMNLVLVSTAVLSLFGLFSAKFFLLLFLVKFNIDAFILFSIAKFFKQESVLKSYVFSSILYPFFSVASVILGFTSSYQWKKRTFKK